MVDKAWRAELELAAPGGGLLRRAALAAAAAAGAAEAAGSQHAADGFRAAASVWQNNAGGRFADPATMVAGRLAEGLAWMD